jgi:hypothetical protein
VTGSVSVTVNGSAAAPVPGFPLPVAGVTAILLCLILGARRRKGSPDVAAQRGV